MRRIPIAFRNLHRAPDSWTLDKYAPHAWRLSRNTWLFMVALCIGLGLLIPPHNPAKMFDEYRPFTIYTVILLATCGVVCAQCARLAVRAGREAWLLMAIGFFFLAVDDLAGIHERLDKLFNRAVGWDPEARIPDLLDAGIVVLYGVIGLIALCIHRKVFFRLQGFTRGISWAAAAAITMVVFDVVGELVPGKVAKVLIVLAEETVEALAVVCFFWTFVTARFQLRHSADSFSATDVEVAALEAETVRD